MSALPGVLGLPARVQEVAHQRLFGERVVDAGETRPYRISKIPYGIVREHGGELELVSPADTGAVVRVSLPAGATR